MKKITIISLGWLGLAVHNKLTELKIEASGAYFNRPKNVSNEYQFDINKPDMNQHIVDSNIVILAIPPSRITDEENFIDFLKSLSDKRMIFISSTSVYGNQGKVDERTVPVPETANGRRLLKWEELIKENFKSYYLIRSGGQYGPSRHPGKFLSGRTGIPGGKDSVNLVSQDALVEMILKTLDSKKSHTINAVNTHHPTKKEYYTRYCKKNRLKIPLFDNADSSSITSKEINCVHSEFVINESLE